MIQLTFIQLVFLSIGGTFLGLLLVGWWMVFRRRKLEREAWERNIVCCACMNPYRLDFETNAAPCPHCGRTNSNQHKPFL